MSGDLTQKDYVEELRVSLESQDETPGVIIKTDDDTEYEFFDVFNEDGKVVIQIIRKGRT